MEFKPADNTEQYDIADHQPDCTLAPCHKAHLFNQERNKRHDFYLLLSVILRKTSSSLPPPLRGENETTGTLFCIKVSRICRMVSSSPVKSAWMFVPVVSLFAFSCMTRVIAGLALSSVVACSTSSRCRTWISS